MKKALVTLAVGEKFKRAFESFCRMNWSRYAEEFGFDLIVISESLDKSERSIARSPAWQKLLILSQEWSTNYDQIVWVDSDVLINVRDAKDITAQTPIEKISAVEAWSIPSPRLHEVALQRVYATWRDAGVPFIDNMSANEYIRNRGIDFQGGTDLVVQTGVFVASPRHHKNLFEHVYFTYEDRFGPEGNFEMPALSHEITQNKVHHWIEPEFNYTVLEVGSAFYPWLFDSAALKLDDFLLRAGKALRVSQRLPKAKRLAIKNIFELSYFTHFSGCSGYMAPMSSVLNRSSLL